MKRRTGLTALLVSLPVLLLSACTGQVEQESKAGDGYHKITSAQAKQKMEETTVIILDVRTPAEYQSGHIKGAVNLPNESIGAQRPAELADLSATLLVYCRSGVRSRDAAKKLVGLGYTQVFDFGGIKDWPYGTVTG